MSELLNSKDFDDGQKIGSEKTLRRWRSACNGRRSFHKLAGPDDRLKLQSNEDVTSSEYIVTETDTKARRFQEPIDDDGSTISGLNKQVRVSALFLKAVLHFTESLSLHSNEDVPSSEYIVTEADTQARRFQQPIDDDGSTISGLNKQVRVSALFLKAVLHFTESLSLHSNEDVPSSEYIVTEADTQARRFQQPIDDDGSTISGLNKQVRVSAVVLKAVLHFTESPSLRSNEDVPSSEYIVTVAATEARIFQEPVDDVGSTVNGLEIFKLLGEYEKRAVAVFYLVLEVTSFLLDIFGKSKKSILLAAFLLSAFGFAITMSTHVRRNIAATGMHLQKRLLMVLELSVSLVQLIVTLIYFILAELGVKNNFNTSVFPLVFAIIAAVFTFKYDGEVTDSSGLDSALAALADGSQVHMPNFTRNEDPEANGSMHMLADFQ